MKRILWIALLAICFALLVVGTAQAYSYNDYYDRGYDREPDWEEEEDDWEKGDDDELEYYDYHTGQWKTIPEPDPYCYSVSYGHSRRSLSPVSVMMPLFIVFFVLLLPWLAYALGKEL